MKILITGVTGFAGCHLVSWLSQRQGSAVELFGVSRRGRWPAGFKQLKKCLRVLRFDWSSPRPLATLLRDLKPEAIFHLAGDTNVAGSFRAPSLAWKANWRTTFFLFEALRAWGGRPRVLLASSGAVYGQAEEVVTEQTELRPNSPYGASKAAADLLAGQVWRSDGIPTIRARLFNVCGPGLPPTLALGSFVQQIVAIERGRARPVLQTGKLSTARDYLHIRDVVRCYVELLQKGASRPAPRPGKKEDRSADRSRPAASGRRPAPARGRDEAGTRAGLEAGVRAQAGAGRNAGVRPPAGALAPLRHCRGKPYHTVMFLTSVRERRT
jgi:GDP-4-dehydro-6-deoxy-D-mannose reductase